jgi:hypothetical protein
MNLAKDSRSSPTTIEQSSRHLGVAEHTGRLADVQIRGDGNTGAFVNHAGQAEQGSVGPRSPGGRPGDYVAGSGQMLHQAKVLIELASIDLDAILSQADKTSA